MKKTIVVSILGTQLDFVSKRGDRWSRWRPNVSLCSQPDLVIDELHLLYDNHSQRLADKTCEDIRHVSPETHIYQHLTSFHDPWDFEEVYAKLFDWCKQQHFDSDRHDYLFHITTGTHVVQICIFLLTESHHFPGRLIQTSPDQNTSAKSIGKVQIIDLDLSRYDQLSSRFDTEHRQGSDFLKQGIATRNARFNHLIAQIEKVAIRSEEPILLTGPTGAGKSQLASRIYQLKKQRSAVKGELVSVNCATLKGDNAMAALFGHTKGAFTGAQNTRNGFLKTANDGVLFLDEIGELGLEEQAMLLHAIENKCFHPVGSDKMLHSNFQLIAGTNRNLKQRIAEGRFREDLLTRINLWTYELPALKDRVEDIAANLEFELEQFSRKTGQRVQFNKEAKEAFLKFAQAPDALWTGNFRDLGAAVTRLCTLAEASRISVEDVQQEILRLQASWQTTTSADHHNRIQALLAPGLFETLDEFDRHQLSHVVAVCQRHNSMAAAGRTLFNVSRLQKSSSNDSSRLQKYLSRFGLQWSDLH
jgi:transcriptional regulatory protein RtcR